MFELQIKWGKREVDGTEKVDTAKDSFPDNSRSQHSYTLDYDRGLKMREHFIALDTQWTGA